MLAGITVAKLGSRCLLMHMGARMPRSNGRDGADFWFFFLTIKLAKYDLMN